MPDPQRHYRDGKKSKWRSASFASQYQTVQAFIEAYGAHQALHGGFSTS